MLVHHRHHATPSLKLPTRAGQRRGLSPTEKWQILRSCRIIDRAADRVDWDRLRQTYSRYARIRDEKRKQNGERRLRDASPAKEAKLFFTKQEGGDQRLKGEARQDGNEPVSAPPTASSPSISAVPSTPSVSSVPSFQPILVVGGPATATPPEFLSSPSISAAPSAPSVSGAPSAAPSMSAAPSISGAPSAPSVSTSPTIERTSDSLPPQGDDVVGVDDDFPPQGDDVVGLDDDFPPQEDDFPPQGDDVVGVDDDFPPQEDDFPPQGDDVVGVDDDLPPQGDDFPPQGDDVVGVDDDLPPQEDDFPPLEDDVVGVDDDLPPAMGPTEAPSNFPTPIPSVSPSMAGEDPTTAPTESPSRPNPEPTEAPTQSPTAGPTRRPTGRPTREPTPDPTPEPSERPNPRPTREPSARPQPTGDSVLIRDYQYNRGNCPDPGSTGLPCSPNNLAEICSKRDGGSFTECLRVCEPSFCCIHDSPEETNTLATTCLQDENCAQYAPCYIVWWKIHDTVGPAPFLRLDQEDDFFDADKLQDVTTERDFYGQWAYHHWDDTDTILYDLLDNEDSLQSLFSNPEIWNPEEGS